MEAMEVMEADVFSWLSTELLLHLLSYLQPDGLIAISATCKTLQAAGKSHHSAYRVTASSQGTFLSCGMLYIVRGIKYQG